jgi:hypothetical protein
MVKMANRDLTLTEEQAMIYVSKYIIPKCNEGNQEVLRKLIFSIAKDIDWNEVSKVIVKEHPELKTRADLEQDLVSR